MHAYTYTHACIYIHTHMQASIDVSCLHLANVPTANFFTYMHARMYACIYSHTYMQASIDVSRIDLADLLTANFYTYIHTYIHAGIH